MKHLLSFFLTLSYLFISFQFVKAENLEGALYRVGVGDVVEIKVLDQPNFSTVATVSADGTMTIPFVGAVSIKNMNIYEIEKTITRRLSEGYLKNPVVSVSLISSTSKKGSVIFVYGEVLKPGELQHVQDMTLLNAILLSGGIKKEASYGRLNVKRLQKGGIGYKDILEIDLKDGKIEDPEASATPLQPDDIVIVERNKTFLLQGEVDKGGEIEMKGNVTLKNALLFTGLKKGAGRVRVMRKQKDTFDYIDVIVVNLNKGVIEKLDVANMLLQPEDIVIVEPTSTFFVEGEVMKGGEIELGGNMTLGKAILAAGVKKEALYGKVKVRRKQQDTLEYQDIIEVKLKNGIIEDIQTANMLLQPGDMVLVEQNKTFFIYGEVEKTGEFVLAEDITVFKAIIIAGGFTKYGSPKRVKILRQRDNGSGYTTIKVNVKALIDGDITEDIKLQPGDIIVVSAGIF